MLRKIKRFAHFLLISLSLVAGYGMFAAFCVLLFIGVGAAACLLVIETIYDPTPIVYAGDVALIIFLSWFFTSKRFRNGWQEFWVQFKSNM